jgi:hypothetical protein
MRTSWLLRSIVAATLVSVALVGQSEQQLKPSWTWKVTGRMRRATAPVRVPNDAVRAVLARMSARPSGATARPSGAMAGVADPAAGLPLREMASQGPDDVRAAAREAIATLASVGAEVYPDFNVFEVAKPYARGLLADRFHPRVLGQRARAEALALGSIARELPYQAHDVLERMRDGTFQIHLENPGIDQLDEHIDQASNRLSVALVVLGGLLGSSIVGVFAKEGPQIIGLHLLSFVGFVVSGAFGLWLMWGVVRHGRL